MADPVVSPGSQTSEHSTLNSAVKWSRVVCGMVAAAVTALLSSGQIPEDAQVYGWLTLAVTILTTIAGEFAASMKYTASRTAVKVAQAGNAALVEATKSDPPKA